LTKLREIPTENRRLFAVGDIHGCRAELSILLDHLLTEEKFSSDDTLIFIGDYVDRGKDAKGVIELLLSFKKEFPHVSFLRGNHEDMLLNFLGFDGNMGEVYLHNGGRDTLGSYGIETDASLDEILKKIPREHLSFLLDLESYIGVGDYIFAHAGLNPLRDVSAQMDEDLFWIREEFIKSAHNFGRTIVFGHTPYQEILFDMPYKIGIDTGCVYGNKLSCLEFSEKRVLQVALGEKKVKTVKF
jgi:serine/threonine protein phosphatase 1